MKPLVAACVLACVAYAQDTGLKARELFYTPPPDAKAPGPKPAAPVSNPGPKKFVPARPAVNSQAVPLGLRYSVLKRDAAGKFAEVDADSLFHSGDRIRLNVDTNTEGFLYVVMQGSSGNWRLLFPSADVDGGSNRVEKGVAQQIPASGAGQFVFDDQSGTEKLFLVLTRKPEPDLDKLIYSINRGASPSSPDKTLVASATVANDVVDRLRDEVKSRDLVFEKVDEISQPPGGQVKTEKATYVVNPSRSEDARLVVDVALKHK